MGSPATQDFKPRKTTRETRGHVITHTRSREEKSGPSFSRGRGMASWWGTAKKNSFLFLWKSSRGLWRTMKRSISIYSAQNEYIRARRAKTSSTELRRREKWGAMRCGEHAWSGRPHMRSFD